MSGPLIVPRGTLDRYTVALPTARVEQLWDRVRQEPWFPKDRDIQFATYVQPPRVAEQKGKLVSMPESVVFLVVSPNPHPRHKGKMIKSFAVTSVEDWQAAEKEAGHYVGVGDPALPIFRELARQHIAARRNMEELNA